MVKQVDSTYLNCQKKYKIYYKSDFVENWVCFNQNIKWKKILR
ncbi:hypothetical protein RCH33_1661 [Flavobacterium daejeonense]|nr:hypothetical protein RCH33_1661 [Flavobacterium daejeonense]